MNKNVIFSSCGGGKPLASKKREEQDYLLVSCSLIFIPLFR